MINTDKLSEGGKLLVCFDGNVTDGEELAVLKKHENEQALRKKYTIDSWYDPMIASTQNA